MPGFDKPSFFVKSRDNPDKERHRSVRMRRKKWTRAELAACPYYIDRPEGNRGRWRDAFEREGPLYLELGCGKGVSTAAMAADNPGVNYLAMDLNADVLGVARRNVEAAFRGKQVDNLKLLKGNAEQIEYFFAPEDRVERIYINFCNPWAKRAKQHKRRLTHTRKLLKYRDFLVDDGEIWFKTDDDALFNATRRYLEESGFALRWLTWDLHGSGFTPNYVSEHERLYMEAGVSIKLLIAAKEPGLPKGAPGECAGSDGNERNEET